MTEFKIVNIVGTITYRQEIDLSALADTFSKRDEINNVRYDPVEMHWVQTYFHPDDTYVAFYRGGRCSIAGAKSPEHFEEVADQVNNVMRDLLNFDYDPGVEISNIVATTDVGCPIPLELLAVELGMDSIEYEPEQFPALIYRQPDHVLLIFSSGKLLCTGTNDVDRISQSTNKVSSTIKSLIE